MVFYEIHDETGVIASAPRFTTFKNALALAQTYIRHGRRRVRIDAVETVWEEPEDV